MATPRWLKMVLILLVILAFVTLGVPFLPAAYSSFRDALTGFATVLTLAALLAYVYFTYVLAEIASTPSATLNLFSLQDNPNLVVSNLVNHSKVSLECWCNINATIYGKTLDETGFYGGKSPWLIQPLDSWHGNFPITDILKQVGQTTQALEKNATDENYRTQLRFKVDFWYLHSETKYRSQNVSIPYYYDFRRKILVGDF